MSIVALQLSIPYINLKNKYLQLSITCRHDVIQQGIVLNFVELSLHNKALCKHVRDRY